MLFSFPLREKACIFLDGFIYYAKTLNNHRHTHKHSSSRDCRQTNSLKKAEWKGDASVWRRRMHENLLVETKKSKREEEEEEEERQKERREKWILSSICSSTSICLLGAISIMPCADMFWDAFFLHSLFYFTRPVFLFFTPADFSRQMLKQRK